MQYEEICKTCMKMGLVHLGTVSQKTGLKYEYEIIISEPTSYCIEIFQVKLLNLLDM